MSNVVNKIGVTCIFGLLLGIYNNRMFNPDSILLSLIGGIHIGKTGDMTPFIEIIEWLFLVSFFLLLSVIRLREKIRIYIYEVIRWGTYRCWCRKLYSAVLGYTTCHVLVCILIWCLMDLFIKGNILFPFRSVVLFLLHLLCCVSMICFIEILPVRNEFIYIPLFLEGGTLLLACKYHSRQIWFWGMYHRSSYVNQSSGFSVPVVAILEMALIILSCLLSSKGEYVNEILHKHD